MVQARGAQFPPLLFATKTLRNIPGKTLIVHHSRFLFTTVVSMSGDHCEIPKFITFSDSSENNGENDNETFRTK